MRNKTTTKNLVALFVAVVICASSQVASALSYGSGTVLDITYGEYGTNARVSLSNPASAGRPTCHHYAYVSHYSMDYSTTKGKALLSTLQAALLAGKRVNINGTGTCLTLANGVQVEAIYSMTILP